MPVTGNGRLATFLDLDMLQAHGAIVYPEDTPDASMPVRTGTAVALELGDRLLLSYLRLRDVRVRARTGIVNLGATTNRVFTTPTPYAPREVVSALALPLPTLPRTHTVLLIPARIPNIQGPRRVSCGYGIEYLLPNGYPVSALKLGWEKEID